MYARPRLATPIAILSLSLSAALLLAACGAGAAASPTPSAAPATAAAPSFTLVMKAPANKTYVQSPTPATSSCATPATGPWTFIYTAAAFDTTEFLTLDLNIRQGAATPAGSNDFRLSIGEFDFIDELAAKSGSHGSTGKVTVSVAGGTAHISVEGVAAQPGASTTLTPVTFDLTCPVGA